MNWQRLGLIALLALVSEAAVFYDRNENNGFHRLDGERFDQHVFRQKNSARHEENEIEDFRNSPAPEKEEEEDIGGRIRNREREGPFNRLQGEFDRVWFRWGENRKNLTSEEKKLLWRVDNYIYRRPVRRRRKLSLINQESQVTKKPEASRINQEESQKVKREEEELPMLQIFYFLIANGYADSHISNPLPPISSHQRRRRSPGSDDEDNGRKRKAEFHHADEPPNKRRRVDPNPPSSPQSAPSNFFPPPPVESSGSSISSWHSGESSHQGSEFSFSSSSSLNDPNQWADNRFIPPPSPPQVQHLGHGVIIDGAFMEPAEGPVIAPGDPGSAENPIDLDSSIPADSPSSRSSSSSSSRTSSMVVDFPNSDSDLGTSDGFLADVDSDSRSSSSNGVMEQLDGESDHLGSQGNAIVRGQLPDLYDRRCRRSPGHGCSNWNANFGQGDGAERVQGMPNIDGGHHAHRFNDGNRRNKVPGRSSNPILDANSGPNPNRRKHGLFGKFGFRG